MKLLLSIPLLATSLVIVGSQIPAHAATESDPFTVSANISVSCTISAGDMAFGNYDPGSGVDAAVTGSIDVNCTNGMPYAVTVNPGVYSSSYNCVSLDRRLYNSTALAFVNYELFSDAAYTSPLGCDASNDIDGVGTGSAQALAVYGRLPVAQSFQPGLYEDTLTATVTF